MGKILEAQYLTVDFLVEADFDLSQLIKSLKNKVLFLFEDIGVQSSTIEMESLICSAECPEEHIFDLLTILDELPAASEKLLKDSRRRIFDIGYRSGTTDTDIAIVNELSTETIQRIAQLNCSVRITLYPCMEHPEERISPV